VEHAASLLLSDNATAVDATYFAASEGADALDVYRHGHLPGARRFDIEAVSRPSCGLPHMLPEASAFDEMMARLGIETGRHLIVYDRPRLRSAPRAWWTFRHFGHERVSVLDGGYEAWVAAGLRTETGDRDFDRGSFRASIQPALAASLDDVIAAAETGSALILDARPAARFSGLNAEPWTPRRGHIRGSLSLPSSTLLNTDGTLKTEAELRSLLAPMLDDRPIIATCGSGIAACVIAFALAVVGRTDVAVFDGSWAEWGQSPRTVALTVGPNQAGDAIHPEELQR